MQKYRTFRLDMAEHKPHEYGLARTILFLASRKTGPLYVIVDKDGPNPQRTKVASLRALTRRLRDATARTFFDWHPDTGPQFRVIKMHPKQDEPVIDLDAAPSVDLIYSATYYRFNDKYGILNLGTRANKPGEHGTEPPNAVDIGVSKPVSADAIHAAILEIANWQREQMLLDIEGEAGLPLNGIIVMYQLCDRSSTTWRPYSGIPHVSHVHDSGWPNLLPGWV